MGVWTLGEIGMAIAGSASLVGWDLLLLDGDENLGLLRSGVEFGLPETCVV